MSPERKNEYKRAAALTLILGVLGAVCILYVNEYAPRDADGIIYIGDDIRTPKHYTAVGFTGILAAGVSVINAITVAGMAINDVLYRSGHTLGTKRRK